MRRTKIKLLSLALTLILIFSCGGFVYAAEEEPTCTNANGHQFKAFDRTKTNGTPEADLRWETTREIGEKCTICGYERITRTIKDGADYYSCVAPGFTWHFDSADSSNDYDRESEAPGHVWRDWEIIEDNKPKPPITGEDGTDITIFYRERSCKRCHAIERVMDQVVHKAPTCTESGYDIGLSGTEPTGDHEYIYYPPKGHDWGEWVEVENTTYNVSPDGKEVGNKRIFHRTCKRDGCNEVDEKAIIIERREPTCAKAGYVETTLHPNIEDSKYEEIEPLPHTFGEWTLTKKQTVFQEGESERVCSVCGAKETMTLKKAPQFLSIPNRTILLQPGETVPSKILFGVGDGYKRIVSTNPKVAEMDKDGQITGISAGTATIFFSLETGLFDSIDVGVIASANSDPTPSPSPGNSEQKINQDGNGSGQTVTKPASKTVNVTKIKATVKGKTKVTLKKGKSAKIKTTVFPKNSTNKKVTYKSSNKKIATVSKSGKIKAKKKGKATITVQCGKLKKKIKVVVK